MMVSRQKFNDKQSLAKHIAEASAPVSAPHRLMLNEHYAGCSRCPVRLALNIDLFVPFRFLTFDEILSSAATSR
jgi:hypothetical protein